MLTKISDLRTIVAEGQKKVLVLAVAQDKYALGAVVSAVHDDIIDAILVGDKREILMLANDKKYDLSGIKIINNTNLNSAVAESVRLVKDGKADILMKGRVSTSRILKGVLNKEYGLRKGDLLSHLALFEIPSYHKLLALTDAAINIAPGLKEKTAILNNSVNYLNSIGISRPKVAVISAVETVKDSMPATVDAAILSKMAERKQILNCEIDGPLALDLAVDKESASHKGIKSNVAGDADLLLFPNIETGNVTYKTLSFLSKTKSASVVLGASAPIVLTSRADNEETKLNSILLAAASQR